VQRATAVQQTPDDKDLQAWVDAVLSNSQTHGDINIRLVDEDEGLQLNRTYRKRDRATNVLSFPAELGDELRSMLESETGSRPLGDLVICAPVVNREAQQQGKPFLHHWAHRVIHGVLHLLGPEHENSSQAAAMEQLETKILFFLGIADPYVSR
jgi:probable rRNA maturation factor